MKPILDRSEQHGAAAQKLRAHYEERLARFREKNDGNLDETKTALVRGKIAEIKYFLSLLDPATEMVVDESDDE